MSSPTLPKDVGLCENCQTPNSKSATKCRTCFAVLPWAQKKVGKSQGLPPQAPPMQQPMQPPMNQPIGPPQASWPQAAPPSPRPEVTFLPPLPKETLADRLNNIHWGGMIGFIFLFLGIMLLSMIWPFFGFRMYFYFSSEENPLQWAAAVGLGLLILLVILAMTHSAPSHQTTY